MGHFVSRFTNMAPLRTDVLLRSRGFIAHPLKVTWNLKERSEPCTIVTSRSSATQPGQLLPFAMEWSLLGRLVSLNTKP